MLSAFENCAPPLDASVTPEAGAVGVLILNAGPAPRAGNSDLSVRIGDRLAARGNSVLRFDPPGLGDSRGSVPAEMNA